jgi:hypothetical protein
LAQLVGVAQPDRIGGQLCSGAVLEAPALGFQRNGVWNGETASQKVEHLGLLFGALASDPRSTVKGGGVPLSSLCVQSPPPHLR